MRNDLFSLLGGLLLSGSPANGGAIENRFVEIDAETYNYQIYTPHDAQNLKDLPVIVFLHGIRERGHDGFLPSEGAAGNLIKQYFSRVPAIMMLPQCRPNRFWSDPLMDEMVMRSLDKTAGEFGADTSRVYMVGVSMGGYGAFHFASRYPEKFAALVSICGGSPIMSGDRFDSLARKIGKTPAWLFHGADDRIVPVTESRQIAAALEKHGGNVKYNEYAGVGHNVWLNVLSERELLPWLLAQKNSE
jgi:predicted peptidase